MTEVLHCSDGMLDIHHVQIIQGVTLVTHYLEEHYLESNLQ